MPPAWATLSAVTWPMPDEAPVITTYFPVNASRAPASCPVDWSRWSSQ